jgi:hypothetical protein
MKSTIQKEIIYLNAVKTTANTNYSPNKVIKAMN